MFILYIIIVTTVKENVAIINFSTAKACVCVFNLKKIHGIGHPVP